MNKICILGNLQIPRGSIKPGKDLVIRILGMTRPSIKESHCFTEKCQSDFIYIYISILQFGENQGLGHIKEIGVSLNRSLKTHLIKILQLLNLWAPGF